MIDEIGSQNEALRWRKSSYSTGDGDGGECVEVARPHVASVGLRDSKSPEAGHLRVPAASFDTLMATIKAGLA
jgi:hypothetical protein